MRTSLLESIVGALNNPRGEQARKVAAWIKTSPPTLLHNLPNPDFRLDSNGLPIRWSDDRFKRVEPFLGLERIRVVGGLCRQLVELS